MAMILITHDMGVVAEAADDVVVMYAGQIVEEAAVLELFDHPEHPYTEALLGALPQLEGEGVRQRRLTAIPGRPPGPRRPARRLPLRRRAARTRGATRARRDMPELREIRPGHFVRSAHPASERACRGRRCRYDARATARSSACATCASTSRSSAGCSSSARSTT